MINFPTIKSLTIPEGNVTKIFDASGNVLWQKGSGELATIKIIVICETAYEGMATYTAYGAALAVINGVKYGQYEKKQTIYTVEVPVGTVIACTADYEEDGGKIYLNNTLVASSKRTATYNYKVVGNAEIRLYNEADTDDEDDFVSNGYIYITEG